MPSEPTIDGSSGRTAASVPDAIRRSIGFSAAAVTSTTLPPSGSGTSSTAGVPPYSRSSAARIGRHRILIGPMADPIRYDERGLAPCVIQDWRTGEVLTLAYTNAEAMARTRDTGELHLWSRSRDELWH